ncbi:hypothetical protein DACRYDRAFT_16831 [Dacryopinax primogenitus]|uniref:DUF6532 domain-containing protein n=1 Tax=Dacryopinax primogenitus (strain DJM 731) TaxID=1858805 RepID=M5FSC5_DACPD|nr:uncharacterized protein DACRYDRAFT_16831 [Dacryopinax primogenitus]EJU00306.1 hypothetical protein DACRYDRAFT_16831 [Dacryopinax primogenitus]
MPCPKEIRKHAKRLKDHDEDTKSEAKPSEESEELMDEEAQEETAEKMKRLGLSKLQAIVDWLSPNCLTTYPEDAQKSLQTCKAHLCILIATLNTFAKDTATLHGLINTAVECTNRSSLLDELPTVTLTPGVLKMLMGEPAHFQGTVKTSARSVIKQYYAFHDKKWWKTPTDIQHLNPCQAMERSGIFGNPVMDELIKYHWYQETSKEADGLSLPSFLEPSPQKFIAFNFTVILCVLEEWASGSQTMLPLSAKSYWTDYLWLCQSIDFWDQRAHSCNEAGFKGLISPLMKRILDAVAIGPSQDPKLRSLGWVLKYMPHPLKALTASRGADNSTEGCN